MIQHTVWEQLFGLVLMSGLLYLGYTSFKSNPDMFSVENTNKSLWKMGTLALVLMAFVYLLIQMVGSGNTYQNQSIDSNSYQITAPPLDDRSSI